MSYASVSAGGIGGADDGDGMSQVALQSLATALHSGSTPITGQAAGRQMLEKNPGVFMNPQQPLVQVRSGGGGGRCH